MTISVTGPFRRFFRSGASLPDNGAHVVGARYSAGLSVGPSVPNRVQILFAQLLSIFPQSHGVAYGLARRRIVAPLYRRPNVSRHRLGENDGHAFEASHR